MTTITRRDGAAITLNLGSNEGAAGTEVPSNIVARLISQSLAQGTATLVTDPGTQPPTGTGVVVLSAPSPGGPASLQPYQIPVADTDVIANVNDHVSPPQPGDTLPRVTSIIGSGSLNTEYLLDSYNYDLQLNGGNGGVVTGDGNDTIAATGNFDIRAGNGNDVVFATGNNFIGTGGNFVSQGGSAFIDPNKPVRGNNVIASRDGNDVISLNGQLDAVFGSGYGKELISGNSGSALLAPGSQNLDFVGGAGGATVFAGTGSDTVVLGTGGGLVFAGTAGRNSLIGGTGGAGSILFGGGDGDSLTARGYAQTTLVADGNATLTGAGSSANDIFYGLVGNSSLQGGTGADTFFVGGSSAPGGVSDTVNGGAGQDLISILAGRTASSITITSFTGAERVTLQGYAGGSLAEAARALATAQVGASTVLTLSDNTRVTFVGVTNLTSGSFI